MNLSSSSLMVNSELTLETIRKFELEWGELRKYFYRGLYCNSFLPLNYLKEMVNLGLPVAKDCYKYYVLVSLSGALYDSNTDAPNNVFFKLTIFKILHHIYPGISKEERNAKFINLLSLIMMLKV